jgi:hypothetical protein
MLFYTAGPSGAWLIRKRRLRDMISHGFRLHAPRRASFCLIATTTPTSACCFPISLHAVPSHQTSSLSAPPPPVTALPNVVQAASAQFPVAPSEMYASVPAVAGGSVANVFAPWLQQQHVSLPNVAHFVSQEVVVKRVPAHVQAV